MSRSRILISLALLAAASSASARDWNTAEVSSPRGHFNSSAKNQISFELGTYELEGDEADLYRFRYTHQGAVYVAGELTRIVPDFGSALDVEARVGMPITVYPALKLIPYGSLGYRHFDFDGAELNYQPLGVGLLAQARYGAVTFGADAGVGLMLNGEFTVDVYDDYFGPIYGRVALDEKRVTRVKLSADWNFAGRHHLLADYSATRFTLGVEDLEAKFKESTIAVGYGFKF